MTLTYGGVKMRYLMLAIFAASVILLIGFEIGNESGKSYGRTQALFRISKATMGSYFGCINGPHAVGACNGRLETFKWVTNYSNAVVNRGATP